jgi:hypothetical protein
VQGYLRCAPGGHMAPDMGVQLLNGNWHGLECQTVKKRSLAELALINACRLED